MSVHPSLKENSNWPRLVSLVKQLAFIDGGSDDAFTLASGRHSRWFFDTKSNEIIQIFSDGPKYNSDEMIKLIQIMDPSNASSYEGIGR